jgi:hypothetical protein
VSISHKTSVNRNKVVYEKLNNLFTDIRNNKVEIIPEMSRFDLTTMNTTIKNEETFTKKKKRFFSELGIETKDFIAIKKYKPDFGCLEKRTEKLIKINKNLENIEFLINN